MTRIALLILLFALAGCGNKGPLVMSSPAPAEAAPPAAAEPATPQAATPEPATDEPVTPQPAASASGTPTP